MFKSQRSKITKLLLTINNNLQINTILNRIAREANDKFPFHRPTGASLVGQYPITLVHIVGFKIIKNRTNILQVLGGMEGLRWGDRVVYKDWGIKRAGGRF